jgi:hypothetical protein
MVDDKNLSVEVKGGVVIMVFDRYTERDELESALNGYKYQVAVDDIWSELFRPRHKHGYRSKVISDLLDAEPEGEGPINTMMDELEKLYHEITNELPGRS